VAEVHGPVGGRIRIPFAVEGLFFFLEAIFIALYIFGWKRMRPWPDDLCTHERCPLSAGLLTGTVIMCQCHGSRFDLTTGAVVNGPATEPLAVHEVRELDGNIQARI
jgi:hypothetical protein